MTTFNLPNRIGRFPEGAKAAGTYKEAGLPNITGSFDLGDRRTHIENTVGALYKTTAPSSTWGGYDSSAKGNTDGIGFDASRSNSIYGKSDTVQPPSIGYLPCIKAFDAAVNPGTGVITELATDLAAKADIDLGNISATGKAKVANLAMPSDQLVELSYVSGSTYTAPADGYFFIVASTSDGGVRLENTSLRTVTTSISHRTWGLGTSIAVRAGDSVYADGYQATVSLFGFLYAEGSKP